MINQKKVRGGKRAANIINAYGDYGRNEAGTPRNIGSNTAGVKREFIGSGDRVFVFYSETHGYLTVRADSFEEAWKLAKSRGYSRRNYKR